MKLERLAREQERECGFMYKKLGLSKACGAQEMSQTLQDEQEKKGTFLMEGGVCLHGLLGER